MHKNFILLYVKDVILAIFIDREKCFLRIQCSLYKFRFNFYFLSCPTHFGRLQVPFGKMRKKSFRKHASSLRSVGFVKQLCRPQAVNLTPYHNT